VALDDALRNAAERIGIQQDFWDIFGHRHFTEPKTNRAILSALGFDCSSEEVLKRSFEVRENVLDGHDLPPVTVVSERAPLRIHGTHDLEITTETGEHHRVRIENGTP
jgi:hypothetical protein